MGAFDDLIPDNGAGTPNKTGAFDDLIPHADDPSHPFRTLARPLVEEQPTQEASSPASWFDRLIGKVRGTSGNVMDRLRTDSAGRPAATGVPEVAPMPTQEEADAAKDARGGQSLPSAYARQAGQGVFGLGDEAEAFVRSLGGESYDEAVRDIRKRNRATQESDPALSTSARLAGGMPLMAVPAGRFLEGATSLGGMAMRSGILGAGFAAAQGFGSGEETLSNRLDSAMKGVKNFATDPVAVGLSVGLPTASYGIGNLGNLIGRGGSGPISSAARRNSSVEADRLQSKLAVSDAADNLEVRQHPSMVMDGPGSTVYRVGMNVPGVGAPARTAIVDTYNTTAAAGDRIARGLGRADTATQGGRALQEGLDAYRATGIQGMAPEELMALNVNPYRKKPPPLPMSKKAKKNAKNAEAIRTSQNMAPPPELRRPTEFRRSAQEMTRDELRRIVRSRTTPFGARSEALYQLWWQSMPKMLMVNNRNNPNSVGAVATRNAVREIQGQVANDISGQGVVGGDLAQRFANSKSHFTIDELRAIRTEVGRKLNNFGVMDQRLDRTQLNQLYGALSRDIELGVQDLANRALIRSQLPPSAPDYVPPAVVRQAELALRNLRKADAYFRTEQQRVEHFAKVLGADTPEKALLALKNAATEGTRGNDGLIQAAVHALGPARTREVAASLLREMWRPNASAAGYVAEVGFSPSTFTTNWAKMSPRTRQAIFGSVQGLPREIENFATVNRALREFEATVNSSNSGTHLITALIGGNLIGSLLGFAKTLGYGAAGYAGMYAWSSPQAVRLMTGYLRLRLNLAQRLASGQANPQQASNALSAFVRRAQNTAEEAASSAPAAAAIHADIERIRAIAEQDRASRKAQSRVPN